MSTIAEVRPIDATPDIQRTYHDIQAASGIPQVNLIWRHFATEPAMLAWAWAAVAPEFRNGRIGAESHALRAALPTADAPPVWDAMSGDASKAVADLVAFYNRGNAQNLLALTALVLWARGEAAASVDGDDRAPLGAAEATEPLNAIPALPRLGDLDAASRAIVERLASRHGGASIGVVPSLYLHLALTPGALERTEDRIGDFVGSAKFATDLAALMSEARRRSARIAAALNEPGYGPSDEIKQTMMSTTENFVVTTIPEMMLVGAYLAG